MVDYLITGCSGFVGSHYLAFLAKKEESVSIVGIGSSPPKGVSRNLAFKFEKINLLDRNNLSELIATIQPRYCIHLASMSSVAESWRLPAQSFVNNTNIFLNLVEGIRQNSPQTRLLSIGSSEQYGSQKHQRKPLLESAVLHPESPYAVARCAQESLARVYMESYDLDIVMTRSFNHCGPGQSARFAVSSFGREFARGIRQKDRSIVVPVGNIDIVRDFLDVRDVVDAYELIIKRAERGKIYNVCSGRGISLRNIIKRFSEIASIRVETKVHNDLVRAVDSNYVVGSHDALTKAVGWMPAVSLDTSLSDILRYWTESVHL